MNRLNIEKLSKHWKIFVTVLSVIVTIGVGRISNDYIQFGKIELAKNNFNKPLTYNEISHAINEKNEILLLQKTQQGYEVLAVLSDSVSAGIANTYLRQKYPVTK